VAQSDVALAALDAIVAALRDWLAHDLVVVWLYGSRARGDSHPESDVDLLVVHGADWRRGHEVMDHASDAG
jgi:predicted nucleotidyltransferase